MAVWRFPNNLLRALLAAVLGLGAHVAWAQDWQQQVEEKPFAEAQIVLQISDGDEAVQARVLNVAGNLLKHYGGPDLVDLEVVAFGPGIALLLAGNAQSERISSLVANGVRFVACMNTVDTMERTSGKRPELNPHALPVQAGVAHLVDRTKQGFVVVRP